MTNIQAINLLKSLEQILDDYCELNDEGKAAFRMAITALEVFGNSEQLPFAQPKKRTEEHTKTHSCDLISRSAAIDYLIGRYSDQLGLMDAQDIIDQLNIVPSAQPELQWISVSERLPEQYGNYLVSFKTDEPDIGTFNPDTGEWSSCDANGFYWVASKGLEVIAWMPLPEPYQEERREE